MATTDAKPGFRLPWSPDRSETGNAADAPADESPTGDTVQDTATAEPETETTDMIDAAPADTDATVAASSDASDTPEAARPALASVPAPARKQNKFMADLTKAMQVAAESGRADTLARFAAEAKAHVETIHETTATEATELRKQADDDVAAIREWSKAEIARIREETDERIVHRKSRLEREIEAHTASIQERIDRVQARVDTFEAEMAAFFERLLGEEDPTRFASMAESLPEPPSFDGEDVHVPVVELIGDTVDAPAERSVVIDPWPESEPAAPAETPVEAQADVAGNAEVEAEGEAQPATDEAAPTEDAATGDLFSIGADASVDESDPRLGALGLTPDFAAAEAEAAAFSADDAQAEEDIPVIADDALAARLAGLVPEGEAAPESESASTKLIVTGLVSVASIAGFKRHLSRVPGLQSVGVSSGPEGEFIFAVNHDPSVAMKDVIATLPGFGARVTAEADGELTVSARDPETEGSTVARPAIVIALPHEEATPVAAELREAGFQAITVTHPDQLDALLASRRDVAVTILDGETDFNLSLEYYGLLRDAGRAIPALMVVSPRTLDQLSANHGSVEDEYVTRPYSAESLRWRVEAMCIRSQTVDDGSGPILQGGSLEADDWTRRATVIAVFNPKGGVGKTTVATNLASALQVRKDQNVLLIDADTVTGHVTTSLGIEGIRTVVDSWRDELEGGPIETLSEIASAHPSGMKVVALTASPLHTEILEPRARGRRHHRGPPRLRLRRRRPASRPTARSTRRSSTIADRILVPVTPDVPAIRAAVQLSRHRVGARLPRATRAGHQSGQQRRVGGRHGDRPSGCPSLALIRSGGLLFVRAANEGRTVIEMFPQGEDQRGLRRPGRSRARIRRARARAPKAGFRIFNRQRAAARA